jgi:hypothetical protein
MYLAAKHAAGAQCTRDRITLRAFLPDPVSLYGFRSSRPVLYASI